MQTTVGQLDLRDQAVKQIVVESCGEGGWFFTYDRIGLSDFPFSYDMDKMINRVLGERAGCDRFTLTFSSMPGSIWPASGYLRRCLDQTDAGVGCWYLLGGTRLKGWLCAGTLKYFHGFPDYIEFSIDNLEFVDRDDE